jgi:23S rRNA pseudouridine2605 synthase
MLERVQKFLSAAGVASRRQAEQFIRSGQVQINGKKAGLGDKVDPKKDVVKVYGKIIKPKSANLYIILNKPKGYVVSRRDPEGRKTVYQLLPEQFQRQVWNVGRLDYDTEGLLVMTNDGDLTQQLAHPSFEHDKEYEVVTREAPSDRQLDTLRTGVELPTGTTYPAKVRTRNGNVYITIHEGKKRQIRRMFETVGLSVKNLKRIRIGSLELPKDLAPGQYREVAREAIIKG